MSNQAQQLENRLHQVLPDTRQITSSLTRLERLKKVLGDVIIETAEGKSYHAVVKSTYKGKLTPVFALVEMWKNFLATRPVNTDRTIKVSFPAHMLICQVNISGEQDVTTLPKPVLIHKTAGNVTVHLSQKLGKLAITGIHYPVAGGVLHPNAMSGNNGNQDFCLGTLNDMEGLDHKVIDIKNILDVLSKPNFTGSYRQDMAGMESDVMVHESYKAANKKQGLLYTKGALLGQGFWSLTTTLGG